MELRHLEVFVAVAEELSFTRASSRLHLVQSGVSSAVKALERDLGAALFDRDRHRVKLTDAGRVLLPEGPLGAVGQPGHPLAARPATRAQLAAEPFIDFPPGWGNRAVADRAFAAAGLDREVPFEAADFTAVIDLVRGGLGIALLPASV